MRLTSVDLRRSAWKLRLAGVVATVVGLTMVSNANAADKEVAAFALSIEERRVGTIRFYSYADGKSGYFKIENRTKEDLKYYITVVNKDGRKKELGVPAKAGKFSKRSGYLHAGSKKTGIKGVVLRKIKADSR